MIGILSLFFFLLLMPLLLGMTIRRKAVAYMNTPCMVYAIGFLMLVVIFGILYFPCLLTEKPLHNLTTLFLIVCICLAAFCLFVLIRTKCWKEWKNPFIILKGQERIVTILWIVVVFLIVFQLFRVVFLQPYEYRDDKIYIALVNDMVSYDKLYGTDGATGMMIPLREVPLKFRLSAWMPLEAVMSQFAAVHPLIICRTVFPAIVLLCHYISMDYLGKWLFPGNEKRRILFLLFVAIINHTGSRYLDQALIISHWPAWGKSVVSSVVMPVILVLMLKLEHAEKKLWGVVLLLLVFAAGGLVSPMGYLIPPVEIIILWLVSFIRKQRRKRHGDAAAGI